jgi:hypothetical protein
MRTTGFSLLACALLLAALLVGNPFRCSDRGGPTTAVEPVAEGRALSPVLLPGLPDSALPAQGIPAGRRQGPPYESPVWMWTATEGDSTDVVPAWWQAPGLLGTGFVPVSFAVDRAESGSN